MTELQNPLPAGWACQLDKKTGRHYYINHYTKTTTWEDPRFMNKPHHAAAMHRGSAAGEHIPLQDLGRSARGTPSRATTSIQDSSLSTASNTEEAVAKISAMFPTVSDTHIRLLLKKYMKSIFPKAEETIILDILSSNDNNIQKASEVLLEMGFQKRDSAKALHRHAPKTDLAKTKEQPRSQPQVAPKPKTPEEKIKIKLNLQEKYKDTPEQVITIALESADFDEDRANQILQIMVQEENTKTKAEEESKQEEITEVTAGPSTVVPQSQSRQSLRSLLKTEKSDHSLSYSYSSTFSRVVEDMEDYRSSNLTNTKGADRSLVKGANQELLLLDYVNWQGPESNIHTGSNGLAKGPNSSLLSSRAYQPCGPSSELRKGPKLGLAKGSIFSQLKGVVVGESRGK